MFIPQVPIEEKNGDFSDLIEIFLLQGRIQLPNYEEFQAREMKLESPPVYQDSSCSLFNLFGLFKSSKSSVTSCKFHKSNMHNLEKISEKFL